MSAEEILNQPTSDAVERAPSGDYTPMPSATPEEPKRREYGGDEGGIREAGNDLAKEREERGATTQDEPVDRGYKYFAGDKAGQDVESNLTLDPERAARELQAVREWEQASQQPPVTEVANVIDQVRAHYNDPQAQARLIAQQQVEQPEQPQQAVDGVDPEIAAAINNPKIRAALESEIATVEQARGQYQQATLQAAQLSAASLFSFAPELASLSPQELPVAVNLIARQNPARAAEINQHLQRTQSLVQAHNQLKSQQEHSQQQQIHRYVQQQDEIFEKQILAKEDPATVARVKENIIDIAEKEFGVSKAELAQLWHSSPLVRSAPFQHMIYMAAKHALAERELVNKRHNPVVPVQRPGVSQPRGDDGDISAAMKAFNADPNPKNAAALLTARRASRNR